MAIGPAIMKAKLAGIGLRDDATFSDQLGTGLQVQVANGEVKLQLAPHSAALLILIGLVQAMSHSTALTDNRIG